MDIGEWFLVQSHSVTVPVSQPSKPNFPHRSKKKKPSINVIFTSLLQRILHECNPLETYMFHSSCLGRGQPDMAEKYYFLILPYFFR